MGRPLRKLEATIEEMISSLGIKRRMEGYAVIRVWREVVGKRIAENAQPKEIMKGTLLVSTSSPAWAEELTFLRSRLREQLNARVGKAVVKEIRFMATGFTVKEKERENREGEGRVGQDIERAAEIEGIVGSLPDGPIRERMRSFLYKEARLKQEARGRKER
jgi:predicted nucleic acid-binding Zn ribbon protein